MLNKAQRAQMQSQLNSIKQPSLIGTGLQIGTALGTDPKVNAWYKKTHQEKQ